MAAPIILCRKQNTKNYIQKINTDYRICISILISEKKYTVKYSTVIQSRCWVETVLTNWYFLPSNFIQYCMRIHTNIYFQTGIMRTICESLHEWLCIMMEQDRARNSLSEKCSCVEQKRLDFRLLSLPVLFKGLYMKCCISASLV